MQETQTPQPPMPWWRFGYVWLIIAGPALVVVAGFITLWLAIRMPDPVITPGQNPQGTRPSQPAQADPSSLAPAVQARNHAQTGVPAAKP